MVSVYSISAAAEDDSVPPMELLEFLADWETTDGQWVDPLELEELSVPPLQARDEGDTEVPGE